MGVKVKIYDYRLKGIVQRGAVDELDMSGFGAEFDAFGHKDWCKISTHAEHLIETLSAKCGVTDANYIFAMVELCNAACAASAYGAMEACAAVLGVNDTESFKTVLEGWLEPSDQMPNAIGPERLMECVEEEQKRSKKFREEMDK